MSFIETLGQENSTKEGKASWDHAKNIESVR